MKYMIYLTLLSVGIIMNISARAELIVLASAPSQAYGYYAEVADDIADFHVAYAKAIEKHGDEVLILSSKDFYNFYVKHLGKDKVVLAPMSDIWMRDFTILNAVKPVMFRYSAAGQGGHQSDSYVVQKDFALAAKKIGLSFSKTKLINDGGNYVDDYAGNVVISKKFLRDNRLSEDEGRDRIRKITGARNVAFIESEDRGGLEHADGVVSFVDENTLIINSYPGDQTYSRQLKADLKAGLPNVKIQEIVTPYDGSEVYDERFASACGLYTNALVTPERIYLPQFGVPEDKIAIKQVKAVTKREVIPVLSGKICHMGGGVRCMALQLRGENAKTLLRYAKGI